MFFNGMNYPPPTVLMRDEMRVGRSWIIPFLYLLRREWLESLIVCSGVCLMLAVLLPCSGCIESLSTCYYVDVGTLC